MSLPRLSPCLHHEPVPRWPVRRVVEDVVQDVRGDVGEAGLELEEGEKKESRECTYKTLEAYFYSRGKPDDVGTAGLSRAARKPAPPLQ